MESKQAPGLSKTLLFNDKILIYSVTSSYETTMCCIWPKSSLVSYFILGHMQYLCSFICIPSTEEN